jgi:tetratricopeptide (TPR) repeat protein
MGKKNYQFLINELIPAIETEFNTSQYRVAVGLSQGADYANYILRNNPELFQAWLIFAIEKPSYTPDFGSYKRNVRTPVDYFIAIANDQENRIEFAHKLDSSIRDSKNFNVKLQLYPNSSHSYCILYGFPDALNFIFESWREFRPRNNQENLFTYYSNLKKETKSKYGLEPNINKVLWHISDELVKCKDSLSYDSIIQEVFLTSSQSVLFNMTTSLITIGALNQAEKILLYVASITPIIREDQQLSPVMPFRTLAFGVYDRQGKYEKAFQTLREGHQKVKDYDLGLLYYMGIYSLKRNFHIEEGIKALEEILTKREQSRFSAYFTEDWIYAQIGDGYARIHNDEEAKRNVIEALKINPDNKDAKNVLEQLK